MPIRNVRMAENYRLMLAWVIMVAAVMGAVITSAGDDTSVSLLVCAIAFAGGLALIPGDNIWITITVAGITLIVAGICLLEWELTKKGSILLSLDLAVGLSGLVLRSLSPQQEVTEWPAWSTNLGHAYFPAECSFCGTPVDIHRDRWEVNYLLFRIDSKNRDRVVGLLNDCGIPVREVPNVLVIDIGISVCENHISWLSRLESLIKVNGKINVDIIAQANET